MTIQQELIKEYAKIATELGKADVSEEKLDKYLEVFAEALADNDNVNEDTQMELLINLLHLQQSEVKSIVESLRKTYTNEDDLNEKIFNETIDVIKTQVERLKELTSLHEVKKMLNKPSDKEIVFFIEKLFRARNLDKYKVSDIKDKDDKRIYTVENKETNERLMSYFNTGYKPKKKIKSYSSMVENIKNNSKSLEVPPKQLNQFWLALRNTYVEQSELNRIKSIFNSGASLEESIKSLIVNKDRQRNIFNLIRKHQQIASQLDEAQKRLY